MFQSDRRGTERKPQSIQHVSVSNGISPDSRTKGHLKANSSERRREREKESQDLGQRRRKSNVNKKIILRRTYSSRRLRSLPRGLPRSRPDRRWPWPGWSARTKSPSGSLKRIKMSLNEGRKEERGKMTVFMKKGGKARQGDLYGKTALILDECVAPFKLILSFPFCSVPSRDAPTASHCSQPRPIPVISLFLRSIRYKAAIFPRRPRPRPPRPDAFERKRQFVYMLSAGGRR